nr:polysaccharide deacetylase family protein [Falsochrobactrum sp. TDYN1]
MVYSIRRNVKYSVIRAGLNAIAFSGANCLLPSAAGRGVIFTLHHVRPQSDAQFQPNAILSVTPQFLAETIQTVLEAGLTPVHLHDLPALLADADDKRRFVAFTLDDGFRNNAQFAAPVFRRFGVPYTVFPAIGFVKRTRTIWWETCQAVLEKAERIDFDFGNGVETLGTETKARKFRAFDRLADFVRSFDEDAAVQRIDELARRCNIDPLAIVDGLVLDQAELSQLAADPLAHIGGHTLSHVNLLRVSEDRLRHEIQGSIAAIEHYCGYRPKSFAYPYGWRAAVGERETKAVAQAGFLAAVTTQPAVLRHSDAKNSMSLNRISLNGYFQKKRYVRALISGLAFKFL